MFLKNKKFIISLLFITLLGGLFVSHNKQQSQFMSEEDLNNFSQDFNKNLPVRINQNTTLIKTKVDAVASQILSLDFFYSYYVNKQDVQNFDILTQNMIYQTCNNITTLSLLKKHVLIRHQFITLDKEKLPYIGVSLSDCLTLKGDKK